LQRNKFGKCDYQWMPVTTYKAQLHVDIRIYLTVLHQLLSEQCFRFYRDLSGDLFKKPSCACVYAMPHSFKLCNGEMILSKQRSTSINLAVELPSCCCVQTSDCHRNMHFVDVYNTMHIIEVLACWNCL